MDEQLTWVEQQHINRNPRPALGTVVLWRGYRCRVTATPEEYGPLQVMVERADGWKDIASTVGLKVWYG